MGRKGRLLTVVIGILLSCSPALSKTTTDIAIATSRVQIGSNTEASASCVSIDSDRPYADKDCDGVKDAGEEYLDLTGGGLSDADYGDITVSGAGTVMSIDTDAVSADELNATGVEAELETVMDLQDMQGAVTDAQVPNNITIDLSTLASTVTIADAAGDTTTFPTLAGAATGSLAPLTDSGLTYNATSNVLSLSNIGDVPAGSGVTLQMGVSGGGVGGPIYVYGGTSTGANTGGAITMSAGDGGVTGAGGAVSITSGSGYSSNAGGAVQITSADGEGGGGNITITAGNSTGVANSSGGNVTITSGLEDGAGTPGYVKLSTSYVDSVFVKGLNGYVGILNSNPSQALNVTGNILASGTVTGSNLSGTNTGDQTSVSGNAGTVTFADAGGDTTTFPALGTEATGSLAPATDAGLTYNANTNVLTSTFSGDLTGNVTGNVSGTSATVTGATQASITTTANLTTVGALGAGSITSGFGAIDVGTDAISGGIGTLTSLQLDSATTGVNFDTDGDGMLILLSTSNGNDEDLRLNLDDAGAGANTAEFTTTTGLTNIYFTSIDLNVPDEAYGGGWDSSTEVPTKNAIYDKIQTLPATASGWTDNGTTVNSTAAGDNFIIGSTSGTAGTSGAGVLGIVNGTAPSTSPADTVQLYAKDGTDTTNIMLHMNGADASTTFTDSSATANTCTANGNAQIDTAQSKFGGASGLFDGSGDYVNVPDAAWMDYGTGAFTVEFWVRFTSLSGTWNYFLNDNNVGQRISLRWRSNNLETYIVSTLNSFAWTPSNSVWYHLAFTRSGTSVRAFVDGTQIGSTGTSSDNISGTAPITIGTNPALDGLVGWMDDFRMMSTAAYTANFTAPAAELPNSNATAELTVRDEAGNTTTLSPHNFEGMPSEAMQNVRDASNLPVTIHHTSPDGMTEQWIDLAGLAMKVEQLTGETLIHTRTHAPMDASGKPLFKLEEAKTLLAAEHPEVNQTALSEKEIYRRATWVKAKVEKEAELQLAYEKEDKAVPSSPNWMKPFLKKEKDRLKLAKDVR